MEETWELAAVNVYIRIAKLRVWLLEKQGKLRRRPADQVDLDAQANVYLYDQKECKYLMAGSAAALFFVIEAYDIDLSNSDFELHRILLPFLVSFLSAACAYWQCYKMDECFFTLRLLSKIENRTQQEEDDIIEVSDTVFGRNYIIMKTISLSGITFIIGVFLVAASVAFDFL